MVQSNSYMVRMALSLDPSSILNPIVHLKYDPNMLALELSEQIGEKLGVDRDLLGEAIHWALKKQKE